MTAVVSPWILTGGGSQGPAGHAFRQKTRPAARELHCRPNHQQIRIGIHRGHPDSTTRPSRRLRQADRWPRISRALGFSGDTSDPWQISEAHGTTVGSQNRVDGRCSVRLGSPSTAQARLSMSLARKTSRPPALIFGYYLSVSPEFRIFRGRAKTPFKYGR